MNKDQVGDDDACLRIYLSFHVSEVKDMPPSRREAWRKGQEVYEHRKRSRGGLDGEWIDEKE